MYSLRPTGALSKGILVKEFVMVHVTCATKYQYKPFLDGPEIFHQVLSVMLILVLKDFLRTKFKSLSLSLQV